MRSPSGAASRGASGGPRRSSSTFRGAGTRTSPSSRRRRGPPVSRIDDAFRSLKRGGGKGLVVYLTAGDPSPAASLSYLRAAADGGADILEVGIPFSDPTADGPTIQAASRRAIIGGGMSVARALGLVSL